MSMKQAIFHWGGQLFDVKPFLKESATTLTPSYATELGALFVADCLTVLPQIGDEMIDTVFADPPFNLGKQYGENTDDQRPGEDYLTWSYMWLSECIRVLKPGGALFVYNLPKWNILLGAFLAQHHMEFRHWIAVDISACLPIPGRLYPSHYSLLYYTKGKPKTFRRIRTPIQTCRHCGGEIKDYGGHRHAMNPKGVTLKDIWTDIPPVRHWKFKSKARAANALSTKIVSRVVEMSTVPGEIVLDPFGGSGTTYVVCQEKKRHWIGIEIEPTFAKEISERLEGDHIRPHKSDDYVEE
jgi:site-specific DNA-methyltransferase (adenine-specific)